VLDLQEDREAVDRTAVKPLDFIEERGVVAEYGLVIACGPKTFDAVWLGGSTTRYWHGVRAVRVIDAAEVDAFTRRQLLQEAKAAMAERRRGAGIRRGQIHP